MVSPLQPLSSLMLKAHQSGSDRKDANAFFGKLYPPARRSEVAARISARRLAPQGIDLYCVFNPFPWVKGKRIAKFSRSGNRIAFQPLRSFFSLRLFLSLRRKKRRYPPKQSFFFLSQRNADNPPNEVLSFLQKRLRDAISVPKPSF